MHVIFVRSPDFLNETIKAVRNILCGSKTLSDMHALRTVTPHKKYF